MKPGFAPTKPRLVAIVGGSGAGKTWLAARLQLAFENQCARLCVDSFYRDRSHLSPAQRARINFDHPRSVDWPLFEAVLGQSLAARPVSIPHYDFAEHRRLSDAEWWHPKPLVLVEGLWLLHRSRLRRRFSFSIFLDCPEEIRLERRLQRDVRERARTAESIRAQFEQTVAPMHKRFVAPQARWADICVADSVSAGQLQELTARLRLLLTE